MKKRLLALTLATTMLFSVACSDNTSKKSKSKDKDDEEIEQVEDSDDSEEQAKETKKAKETDESDSADEDATDENATEVTEEPAETTEETAEDVVDDGTPAGKYASLIADTQAVIKENEKYYVCYDSGMSGFLKVYKEDTCIYFTYEDDTNEKFTVLFFPEEMTASASAALDFEENYGCYYSSRGPMTLSDIKDFIDAGEADTECFILKDDIGHGEVPEGVDTRDDLARLYARWYRLFDKLLNDFGYSYEDLGLEKDRMVTDVSATEKLDSEPQIVVSEHVFEDGVCTDCGKDWKECYNETMVASYPARYDGSLMMISAHYLPSFINNYDYVLIEAEPEYNSMNLFYYSTNFDGESFSMFIYDSDLKGTITFNFDFNNEESLVFECLPEELGAIMADPTFASLPSYMNIYDKDYEMTPEFWAKCQETYSQVMGIWNDALSQYGLSLNDRY